MTVKVIKKRKSVYKATCNHCFSRLEFEDEDPKFKEYTCCGKPESGEFLNCPSCGKDFELDTGWRSTKRAKRP